MAEIDLERFFADAPPLADADAFAERLKRRLDRRWALRRGLIGAAGAIGGVIAVSQLLVSGLVGQLRGVSTSTRALATNAAEANVGRWLAIPYSGEAVVWTAAGLAVLLTVFVLTRVVEEI